MAKIKSVGVKLNGRSIDVPAHYLYEGGTVGTYVHARLLVEALGVGQVQGKGDHIEIVTEALAPKPLAGRRIALSAGHYGKRNQSPCDKSYYESEFVLKVALEAEKLLKDEGAEVYLPRRTPAKIALEERAELIDRFKADITLDIHTNAFIPAGGPVCNTAARGVRIYHQLSRPNDPLALLLLDEVSGCMGLPAGGLKTKEGRPGFDWYFMLRVPHSHNVLIEAGFHTSRDDIKVLTKPDAHKLYAQGIRNALVKFVE